MKLNVIIVLLLFNFCLTTSLDNSTIVKVITPVPATNNVTPAVTYKFLPTQTQIPKTIPRVVTAEPEITVTTQRIKATTTKSRIIKNSQCETTYTLGKEFRKMYDWKDSAKQINESTSILKFKVRLEEFARILLSPRPIFLITENDISYEITIGAQGNSSYIIKITGKNQREMKIRKKTPLILDSEIMNGFWIRVTNHNIITSIRIEVGKDDEVEPFLDLIDINHNNYNFIVKHFYFSAWHFLLGRWELNCKTEDEDDKKDDSIIDDVFEQEIKSYSQELLNQLLRDYDPNARTAMDFNERTMINFNIAPQYVTLDQKSKTMTLYAWLQLSWVDEKLKWDPKQYDNINILRVPFYNIWVPDLNLYNSADGKGDIMINARSGTTLVNSNGSILFTPSVNLKVFCSLNMENWPNDIHTCSFILGSLSGGTMLAYTFDGIAQFVNMRDFSSEWEILEDIIINYSLTTHYVYDINEAITEGPVIKIDITVQRKSQYYITLWIMPLIAIFIQISLTFYILPHETLRIILNCINLLILIIFIIVIGLELPVSSNGVPRIVKICSSGIILSTFAIVVNIVLYNLIKYNISPPIDSFAWLKRLQKFNCCIPDQEVHYDGIQPSQDENILLSGSVNTNSFLFAILLDKIFLFIFIIVTILIWTIN